MTLPDAQRLFQALDATWPAATQIESGGWVLRQGLGGGQRVSAATASDVIAEDDIAVAEEGMRALNQRPLFMITDGNALDTWLAALSYDIVDPVSIYCAKSASIAGPVPLTSAIPSWPPLAVQAEIWDLGGVTAPRRAVMARATGPKTSLLGRAGDVPCGAVFAAADGDVAMVHALEVLPDHRRCGVGRTLMTATANWSMQVGAEWLALAVTKANDAANAMYQSLGMSAAAAYHYRRAPEVED